MPDSLREVMSSRPEEEVFTGEIACHLAKLSEDLCCNVLKPFLNFLKGRFYIYIYKSIQNFTLTFIVIIQLIEIRN